MKLRNIFTILAAALTLAFVGCVEQEHFLDEVKVSKSFITFPVEGAEVKVEVDAVADWQIVALDEKYADAEIPEWLTVDPLSGSAGKTEVSFIAGEATESREVTLNLICGDVRQTIKVAQYTEKQEAPLTTCNKLLTEGEVGVFYRVKGVVAEIPLADFQKYGKFFITDDSTTEKVQIYGLANKSSYLDGDKPKIDVGDVVVVEGSWSKYGNFNNDAQILSVEKSLIKVEKVSPVGPLSAEGDVFTVTLTNKGEDFEITIPEEDKTWLSYSEPFVAGTTYVVEFTATANPGTPRSTEVTFETTSGGVKYTASVQMEQDGALPVLTISEAVASGETCVVVGKVLFAHSKGLLITDGTNVLYAYLGAASEVVVDDVVKLTGAVTLYNGGRSMNKPTVEKVEETVGSYRTPSPVVLDAAKFAEYTSASADFATPYVTITGVAETDSYNNLIVKLVDGETTYSIKSYYANESYADWAGKEVKVCGYAYNAYNDTKQVNLLVTSVADADAEEPAGPTISTIASVLALGANATIPADTFVEGVVISNMDLNNLTSKKGMYIQDETAGLQFYLAANHTFKFGDKVKVDLSGAKVAAYNGAVQISGLALDKIELLSSGNAVEAKTVTIADFLANKYEGQYIALEGVQVASSDLSNTFVMGGAHTSINMEDASGNKFVVFSSKYATYGTTAVPQGSGTIKGIAAKNNETIQIIFAQESDFAGLTGERF